MEGVESQAARVMEGVESQVVRVVLEKSQRKTSAPHLNVVGMSP